MSNHIVRLVVTLDRCPLLPLVKNWTRLDLKVVEQSSFLLAVVTAFLHLFFQHYTPGQVTT